MNEENPHRRWVSKAAEIIREGGIVIYPTDTNYAAGCDIFNKKTVERLYRVSHRSRDSLMSCILYDFSIISQYASVSSAAYRLMKKYLPGPYTFILNGRNELPKLTLTKQKTIGIRMPDNNIIRALSEAYGAPILNTHIVPENHLIDDPEELMEEHQNDIDLMLLSRPIAHERTTLIDLSDDDNWFLAHQGLGEFDLSDLH